MTLPTWTEADVDEQAVMIAVRHSTILITTGDDTHRIELWNARHTDALATLAELLDWLSIPLPFDPPIG
ncbi:MAG: hypothetical protein IRZ32_08770 [Solirubrobacteraceae bacterium]|nr:hypothetical protein [Solirubrobacteraceae bacterium]